MKLLPDYDYVPTIQTMTWSREHFSRRWSVMYFAMFHHFEYCSIWGYYATLWTLPLSDNSTILYIIIVIQIINQNTIEILQVFIYSKLNSKTANIFVNFVLSNVLQKQKCINPGCPLEMTLHLSLNPCLCDSVSTSAIIFTASRCVVCTRHKDPCKDNITQQYILYIYIWYARI